MTYFTIKSSELIPKIKILTKGTFKLLDNKGLKWLLIGLISSAGIAVVELFVSIIIQLLLRSFGFLSDNTNITYFEFLNKPIPIFKVTLLLCAVAVIRFIVQLTSTQTTSFLKEHVNLKLRQNSAEQILFSTDPASRVSSQVHFKMTEIFTKASDFIFYLSQFLMVFIQSFFLFIILCILSWKESIVATIGILLIGICIYLINQIVSQFAKQVPVEQKKLNEGIEKIIRNFFFIKLMRKRNDEHIYIRESINSYSEKSIRANFFSNFAAQIGPFLGIFLLVCIILISQYFWKTKPIILISYIYLLSRFVQSLSILSGYFGFMTIFFPQYKLALESTMNEKLEFKNEISIFGQRKRKPVQETNTSLTESNQNIACPNILFQDMSFNYDNSKPIFHKLNFEIQAGTQVGIMGASGTGKSTFLMLITGILQPKSGSILIQDVPCEEYIENKHNRIGYVGAEPFLIQGSLRDNLCYGLSAKVTLDDIEKVLKMVSLDSFVQEKTLNYIIGEDQQSLSTGQKQRLCLARAILNKPSLLILDEATANLDENNEKQVAQILKNLKNKCTTIIVSHRSGILAHADKLIEISDLIAN